MATNCKEVVATTYVGENLLAQWSDEEREARKQEIMALVDAYCHFTGRSGQFRHQMASDYGGFWLTD